MPSTAWGKLLMHRHLRSRNACLPFQWPLLINLFLFADDECVKTNNKKNVVVVGVGKKRKKKRMKIPEANKKPGEWFKSKRKTKWMEISEENDSRKVSKIKRKLVLIVVVSRGNLSAVAKDFQLQLSHKRFVIVKIWKICRRKENEMIINSASGRSSCEHEAPGVGICDAVGGNLN